MTAAGPGPSRVGGRSGPRLFALLGRPVEHSLSPAIHAAAFRELDVDAVYVGLAVRGGELEGVLSAVARAGGGNVTTPHKRAVARLLDRRTRDVRRTGACNCFWAEEGEVAGDNTDVGGFREAVGSWEEVGLDDARVLLLGAGGAARAVLAACLDAGAGSVDVWNRTTERARELVRSVGGGEARLRVLESRDAAGGPYDLVVNATALGLRSDDPLPLSLDGRDVGGAFDLVYGPSGTDWTRHARRAGVPARDGLEMLVRQAGLSLRRWLDVDPPLEAMRRAVGAAPDPPAGARGLDG